MPARLADGSQIAAATVNRKSSTVDELNKAIYTPCEVCAEDPNPTWSVQAEKVTRDKAKGIIIYRNAVLRVPEPGPEQGPEAARAQLTELLSTWTEGMRWPLPLPPGVALQWLKDKENTNALADAYEGSEFKSGEKGKDPALARTYPTVEDLLATGEFERLAQTVYAPLKAWAEQLVIEPLPDAPEDDISDAQGELA